MPPSRWGRAVLIALSGIAAALAFPPLDLIPGLLGWCGLVWAVRTASDARRAAAAGWLWAFGYHVVGLHWIANAMLVDGERHAWLIPFALLGLPALLAFFMAAAAWAARKLARDGIAGWLALVGFVAIAEWLRGHVLTGFPWSLAAYAWDAVEPVQQVAALLGAYGLSLVTMLVASAPALWLDPAVRRRPRVVSSVAAAGLAAAGLAWGQARLAGVEVLPVDGVVVRVVQGNVPQRDKWNPVLKPRHMLRYLRLSDAGAPATVRADGLAPGAAPTLVVWPETAIAFTLGADPDMREALGPAIPPGGALVSGAVRVEGSGPEARVFNSVYAFGPDGRAHWVFDKFHLVPFGEYVPLRSVLPIGPIVRSARDFTPGPGPRTLDLPAVPAFSVLVCYEAIFPGAVAAGDTRPAWLLNVTNDAWFGDASGPYQHLAIARLRAVEEGLALIRAANTGISAAFDPLGRELAAIPVGRTGSIDTWLPAPLPPTLYARLGDTLFFLMVAILLAPACMGRVRKRA